MTPLNVLCECKATAYSRESVCPIVKKTELGWCVKTVKSETLRVQMGESSVSHTWDLIFLRHSETPRFLQASIQIKKQEHLTGKHSCTAYETNLSPGSTWGGGWWRWGPANELGGDPSSRMIFCCENYFPSFMDALLSPAIIIRHLAHGLREETQIS